MKRQQAENWLTRLIWLAGFILLIIGTNYLNNDVLWRLGTSEGTYPFFVWISFLMPFLTGMYLSLLVLPRKGKLNDPSLLWVVAVPITIIAVLNPLVATVSIPLPELVSWLVETLNQGNLLPLAAGFAILPSIKNK